MELCVCVCVRAGRLRGDALYFWVAWHFRNHLQVNTPKEEDNGEIIVLTYILLFIDSLRFEVVNPF